MEILLTGHLSSVSESFCKKLALRHKVVACSEDIIPAHLGKSCITYAQNPEDNEFLKLFTTYYFETVIYFAKRPEENVDFYHEFKELDDVLRLCSEYNTTNFIYISSTFVYEGLSDVTESSIPVPVSDISLFLDSCEKLLALYRKSSGMSILVMHTPCLFGDHESSSIVGNLAQQVAMTHSLQICGTENQTVDFLSQADLGELVLLIVNDFPSNIKTMNVPGASTLTFGELVKLLHRVVYATRISFAKQKAPVFHPVKSDLAFNKYMWKSETTIENEIFNLINKVSKTRKTPVTEETHGPIEFLKARPTLLQNIEIIAGYSFMELFNKITGSIVVFRYFDFRLLYVVLIANVFGLKAGIAASLLAIFSSVVGLFSGSVSFGFAIPLLFAGYLAAGILIGLWRDKRNRKLEQLSFQKQELEKKYSFMNNLYVSTLDNKQQLKRQFLNYRDSFGRILKLSERLNATFPDLIFQDALFALEEILENHSISIYSVNAVRNFARLNVCSHQIIDTTPTSLDLLHLSDITEQLSKNELWVNQKNISEYPDYIFPLYNENELTLLVMVDKATTEQKAEYFGNLLKIICHYIEVSLLRAQQYTKKNKNELYLPSSRVLKNQFFKDVLRSRVQMEENSISKYKLISLDTDHTNLVTVANRMQNYLRDCDVFGEGKNGQLYVILSQASEKNVAVVLNRLRNIGIPFQNISDDNLRMA